MDKKQRNYMEGIQTEMKKIIIENADKFYQMSDSMVAERRAKLVALIDEFRDLNYNYAYNQYISAELEYERIRAEVYRDISGQKGMSATKATQVYKADSRYLKAYRKRLDKKRQLDMSRMLIDTANQALNSMSSKFRN